MSSMVDYLRQQYYNCNYEIEQLEKQRTKCEEAYDSLVRFQQDVSGSEGEMRSAISSREQYLAALTQAEVHCVPIQKYHSGMNDVLGGLGSRTVLRVFTWMNKHVESEKKGYMNKISEIDKEIRRKRARQEELLLEIHQAETLEDV